jgi:AcrR family transcriptional regulator
VAQKRGAPPAEAAQATASGVKKDEILRLAGAYFGQHGYEETKWAEIAAGVNVGATALYHYFESKQHCLFEVMTGAVVDLRQRFEAIVAAHEEWTDALVALLVSGFELTDDDVLKLRVLVQQQNRVGVQRPFPREEAARVEARSQSRELERAWVSFIAQGIQEGVVPEGDSRLLARAVLGIYNSIWHWYKPGGTLSLADIGEFYVGRELAILGCDPELATRRLDQTSAHVADGVEAARAS